MAPRQAPTRGAKYSLTLSRNSCLNSVHMSGCYSRNATLTTAICLAHVPRHQGGPLWMADNWGVEHIVNRLEHYAQQTGDIHGYWTPAPLLKRLAAQGARISDWLGVELQ